MLTTFEQLVLEATGLVSSRAPLPLAVEWASTMINELSRTKKLQHYRTTRELYLPPVITEGTVTATRDSFTITGNATAQAAWLSGHQMSNNNYYIRVKTIWYPIGDIQGVDLILRPPSRFAEDTATAHSYLILKKYHQLDQDVDQLDEHMTNARFGSLLPLISKDQMDFLFPGRWSTYSSSGGVPSYVCEIELSPDQRRQVEVYPYPQKSELIYYNAWLKPPPFQYTDPIPNFINYAALIEGVKYKLYEYEANRAQDPQMKQLLLNEKARQGTIWGDAKKELFLHEAAASQGGMSVQMLRDRFVSSHRDINSAYSQVWSREP